MPWASTASTSAGRKPGVGERGGDDAPLGGAAGGGEAVGGAVLVDRRAAHQGEDAVAVGAGPGEALHQQQPDALGETGAVGGVGEGLAAAVTGQAALRRKPISAAGLDIRATPPARARSLSPLRTDRQARWRATREDEQAVSTVTAGPSKPKV